MDTLPKNNDSNKPSASSGDDITSFAGSYPAANSSDTSTSSSQSGVTPFAPVPHPSKPQDPTSNQPSPQAGSLNPFSSQPLNSSQNDPQSVGNTEGASVTDQSVSGITPFVDQVSPVQSAPDFTSAPPPTASDLSSVPFAPDNAGVPVGSATPESFVQQDISPTPVPSENPFIVPETPAPSQSRGAGRRVLAIIILLVALIAVGFLAFRIIGRLLTSNQPVVLTYWGLWETDEILTPIINEYKQSHPNVEIAYARQSPRQYRERLQAALNRGEGPDIFRFHNTWLPMLSADLAPAGSMGYTASEFQQTFYPVAAADLVIGTDVYGVPLMIDGLGLYYNEDLLRAAGVTPPSTWEDFRQAAITMTVKDETGKIITSGAALGTAVNIEHFSDILGLMMLQNGADLKNPAGDRAREALEFYRLFGERPGNTWDESLDNSILAFASGKVAFIFAPSWEVFTIREANPNLKFQIIPIPQLPGTTATWASYWVEGVAQASKHKEEAWEFLKFISSKESMITLYTEESKLREFGEPYSRIDLAQTVINDPYVGAYIRQASTMQSFFLASRTFDNGINDRMIKYLEDGVNSLSQGVSEEAALATVSQGFDQVLRSYGLVSAPTKNPK